MKITSSASLRNNYRKIADECKATGETVFLTTNGEGELVLMSIDTYNEMRTRLRIESELLRIEAERAAGRAAYVSLDEFEKRSGEILHVAEGVAKVYDADTEPKGHK